MCNRFAGARRTEIERDFGLGEPNRRRGSVYIHYKIDRLRSPKERAKKLAGLAHQEVEMQDASVVPHGLGVAALELDLARGLGRVVPTFVVKVGFQVESELGNLNFELGL